MRAVCWEGKKNVKVNTVPDPEIVNPRDAVVRVTSTAICGSDLHLYDGYVPSMKKGDILGHEFMGEIVETGSGAANVKKGDRVIVPFAIACGSCFFCKNDLWSLCDNSNPNARAAEKMNGFATSGLFGYSHLYGGYAGGQAEYVRVPFADVGAFRVPDELPDEKLLFLTDIFPTGYMAAENCHIRPGDTVCVWGCGPVGLFAMKSAWFFGAGRVIAIDRFDYRLAMAREHCGAETIDYEETEDVVEALKEMTGGLGPDACIDAVGMEAHGSSVDALADRVKQKLKLEMDRANVLRQAVQACRKGGTVSIPGVYAGFVDKAPLGAAFAKGLALTMGQTHVHRYVPKLLELVKNGEIDPSFVISHRRSLDEAPECYSMFVEKRDDCVKVVLKP